MSERTNKISYIYASGVLVGQTSKWIGIVGPMHARAVFTLSECKAMGIERGTVITAHTTNSEQTEHD